MINRRFDDRASYPAGGAHNKRLLASHQFTRLHLARADMIVVHLSRSAPTHLLMILAIAGIKRGATEEGPKEPSVWWVPLEGSALVL
jgi:hypothetical protein